MYPRTARWSSIPWKTWAAASDLLDTESAASSDFILHEAGHDCTGEDCPICQAIAMNGQLLRLIGAVIIVLAMNLVGSLLISALIIFPAMSAMRLFRSFKSVTVFSALLWESETNT